MADAPTTVTLKSVAIWLDGHLAVRKPLVESMVTVHDAVAPITAKVTGPTKPLIGVTDILAELAPPAITMSPGGMAERPKSVTWKLTVFDVATPIVAVPVLVTLTV